jgi:hypothetical protein
MENTRVASDGSIDHEDARRQSVAGDNPAVWAELPFFVESGPGYYDCWRVGDPSGDNDMDRMLGELYADIAVRYARAVRNPAFVAAVMSTIYFKTARGLIPMGATERAFLSRIAGLAYVGSLN